MILLRFSRPVKISVFCIHGKTIHVAKHTKPALLSLHCYETGLGKIPHKAGKHVFMYKLEHV